MTCVAGLRPASVAIVMGALACALGAGGQDAKPRFGVKDVMDAMVVAASDALFGVGRREPDSAQAWMALRYEAVILAEAGRALTAPGRSPGEDWDAWSIAMSEAAAAAAGAIDARDVDGVLVAGGDIIESCTAATGCICRARGSARLAAPDWRCFAPRSALPVSLRLGLDAAKQIRCPCSAFDRASSSYS